MYFGFAGLTRRCNVLNSNLTSNVKFTSLASAFLDQRPRIDGYFS